MIKKLQIKFVCINMVIVTAMLSAIFFLIIFFMGIGMQIQEQRLMRELAEQARMPEPWAEEYQPVRRPHMLVQLGEDGSVLAVDGGQIEEAAQEVLLQYVQQILAQGQATGRLEEPQIRYELLPLSHGKMLILLDISTEMVTMRNLMQACLLTGAASFGVFLIISILLARWAVKPVEEAWNRQRQFVADASHELKTPLTVIMTNAELLQSPDYGEAERKQFSASILTMSRQMRGLVESLLELARVDNGMKKMTVSQLNFSELVEDCLLPFEPVYFEKDLLLESELEAGLQLRGSESHLRQVVDILLDNAAKYSQTAGTVRVTLKKTGNTCLLRISNPGDPLSREELDNLFKRFYRSDKARAMCGSYGLGLPIAEGIVQNHGGKIWAESSGKTNTFCVQLPLF